MFEESLDGLGFLLKRSQMRNRLPLQLGSCSNRFSAVHAGFEVVVQVFIRIEFRTVGGKIEYLDPIFVLFQPLPDRVTVVHFKIIQDQEDLAVHVLDQPCEELLHDRRVHSLAEQHEPHLTLVGNRGDQTDILPSGTDPHEGCLAPWSIAAAILVAVAQTGFIAPMDLRLFPLGSLGNDRVLLLKPLLDRFGVLLIGPSKRLLRSEPPALQVLAHRADRHSNPPLLLDDLLNTESSPQSEGKFQLIRCLIPDQDAHLFLLLLTQGSAHSQPAAPLLNHHPFLAALLVSPAPLADRGVVDADDLGDLLVLSTALPKANGLVAQLLLDFWTEFACVNLFHARDYNISRI